MPLRPDRELPGRTGSAMEGTLPTASRARPVNAWQMAAITSLASPALTKNRTHRSSPRPQERVLGRASAALSRGPRRIPSFRAGVEVAFRTASTVSGCDSRPVLSRPSPHRTRR